MTTFQNYLTALTNYARQNGHTRVPAGFVSPVSRGSLGETYDSVNLGYWVSYIRARNRSGLLDGSKKALIESAATAGGATMEWGPLKPGPRAGGSETRDQEIRTLREQGGYSLQKIADRYGLTRQRVHQLLDSKS